MIEYYYDKYTRLLFFRPDINERYIYANEFCVKICFSSFNLRQSDILLK